MRFFKLRMPGRFERKILAALFIIASLPLGAAAYLLSVTLGRISNTSQIGATFQETQKQAIDSCSKKSNRYCACACTDVFTRCATIPK